MKFTDIKTTEVYWDEHIQPRFNDLYTYYNSIGNEEIIMEFRSMVEESLKYYFTDTIDLHESRAIRKTGYEYTFFKQYHTKINNFARSFTPYYLTDIKVRDKGYYHIQGITVPGYSFSLHTPLNNQGLPDETQESFISGSTTDQEKELIKKIIIEIFKMIDLIAIGGLRLPNESHYHESWVVINRYQKYLYDTLTLQSYLADDENDPKPGQVYEYFKDIFRALMDKEDIEYNYNPTGIIKKIYRGFTNDEGVTTTDKELTFTGTETYTLPDIEIMIAGYGEYVSIKYDMMDISVIQKGEDLQIDIDQVGSIDDHPVGYVNANPLLSSGSTHEYIKDYIPVLLAYLWCLKTGVPR